MTRTDIKTTLYQRIQKTNESGKGYQLGKGYNQNWFKALDELKTAKKVVSKRVKLFVSKKTTKTS